MNSMSQTLRDALAEVDDSEALTRLERRWTKAAEDHRKLAEDYRKHGSPEMSEKAMTKAATYESAVTIIDAKKQRRITDNTAPGSGSNEPG